jgi:hypothetical protein
MRGVVADGGNDDGKDVLRPEHLACAAEPLLGTLPRPGRPAIELSELCKGRDDAGECHKGVSRLQDVGRMDVVVVRVGRVVRLPDTEEE